MLCLAAVFFLTLNSPMLGPAAAPVEATTSLVITWELSTDATRVSADYAAMKNAPAATWTVAVYVPPDPDEPPVLDTEPVYSLPIDCQPNVKQATQINDLAAGDYLVTVAQTYGQDEPIIGAREYVILFGSTDGRESTCHLVLEPVSSITLSVQMDDEAYELIGGRMAMAAILIDQNGEMSAPVATILDQPSMTLRFELVPIRPWVIKLAFVRQGKVRINVLPVPTLVPGGEPVTLVIGLTRDNVFSEGSGLEA